MKGIQVVCRLCAHRVRLTLKGKIPWHYDDAAFLDKCDNSGVKATVHNCAGLPEGYKSPIEIAGERIAQL